MRNVLHLLLITVRTQHLFSIYANTKKGVSLAVNFADYFFRHFNTQ